MLIFRRTQFKKNWRRGEFSPCLPRPGDGRLGQASRRARSGRTPSAWSLLLGTFEFWKELCVPGGVSPQIQVHHFLHHWWRRWWRSASSPQPLDTSSSTLAKTYSTPLSQCSLLATLLHSGAMEFKNAKEVATGGSPLLSSAQVGKDGLRKLEHCHFFASAGPTLAATRHGPEQHHCHAIAPRTRHCVHGVQDRGRRVGGAGMSRLANDDRGRRVGGAGMSRLANDAASSVVCPGKPYTLNPLPYIPHPEP